MPEQVIGLVGTYPPTRCGIASFTESLDDALRRERLVSTRVVRLVDDAAEAVTPLTHTNTPGDLHNLVAGDSHSLQRAAEMLSATCDAVIVQHEFGIYAGDEGAEVLALLSKVQAPTILVLHSVLREPSHLQRAIIEQACRLASTVVVMCAQAEATLLENYVIDDRRVRRVPHGTFPVPDHSRGDSAEFRLVTWGLLGPGKGIEWALMAIALLDARAVSVRYRVIGQTHPKVWQREGEQYRLMLVRLSHSLGINDRVEFINSYLDRTELARQMSTSDLVVLPYDSTSQATSGVLAEALAARMPVVATRFPHAVEMVPHGRGWVVPHQDPLHLADAIEHAWHTVRDAQREPWPSARRAVSTSWTDVARMYLRLATRAAYRRTA